MHLVCLGVMRTLLYTWNSGPLPLRLSATHRRLISDQLISFRQALPSEFNRLPRELSHLHYWKATELRTFLLYLGPVTLKPFLDEDKYNHFLQLHVALTILLSPKMCSNSKMREYARGLLGNFVHKVSLLYGPQYLTHNFHNLIHLTDDADYFVQTIPDFTLHNLSAFPFENYLQTLKSLVRSRSKPLQQIGRRLGERFNLKPSKPTSQVSQKISNVGAVQLKNQHFDGPLPALCSGPQYKTIIYEHFKLSTSQNDNCCQTKSGTVVVIENIAYSQELKQTIVIGKKFLQKYNFYPDLLCDSSHFGIYKVSKLSGLKFWAVSEISKMFCLALEREFVVFPLLHCTYKTENTKE